MLTPRAAVLVSGGGTNLQAILDKRGTVIRSGEVALVVSNKPGAFALERAEKAGIENVYIPYDRKKPEEFERELERLLKLRSIDVIVLAGFLAILSGDFVEKYPKRIINIHPSLIPAFCGRGYYGLKVHEAALERGVKLTGATVHFVNGIPDGGEIIAQRAVEVLPGDTPEKLQRRVMEQAEWEILPAALEAVFKGLKEKE